MKILYIADIRLPTEKAHGLQIMKTCEALAAAGATLELVVPTRRTTFPDDPFVYYGVKEIFMLTRLGVPDLINFGQLGVLAALLMFAERARWLRSFWRSDIIYSRDHLVLLQYLLLGRTFVFEAHAPPTFFSRIVARQATRVVVISKALKEAYESAGISSERLVLAPDAVDLGAFENLPDRHAARATLGLPADKRIVTYVGHLYARKGAHTLADAATLAPDALFVFVGGTPVDIAYFTTIYSSTPNIRIEGYVPPASVPLYLRAADVLVIPNSAKDEDSARYTSPMKLFEYMASGTPILASDVPALREVLDEQTALFAAPDDTGAFARAVHTLLSDRAGGNERARAARRRVEACTWEERGKRILRALTT